jgi:hypothetical protein
MNAAMMTTTTSTTTPQPETSYWSSVEHSLFEDGIVTHGWGKWMEIACDFVRSRDRIQVRTHGRKLRQNHQEVYHQLVQRHADHFASDAVPTGNNAIAINKMLTEDTNTKSNLTNDYATAFYGMPMLAINDAIHTNDDPTTFYAMHDRI